MSDAARENAAQPLLSAEWLRQPEVVELVQHMAAFAAALTSHLFEGGNPSVDNNVASNVGRPPAWGGFTKGWDPKWGDTRGIGPDEGYDPPDPDYSKIPKGAGKELKDYMRSEAKRRVQDTSAGFESLSTKQQLDYIDGIRDGSIREDSGSWQRGLEYGREDAPPPAAPDVASQGGVGRARAE